MKNKKFLIIIISFFLVLFLASFAYQAYFLHKEKTRMEMSQKKEQRKLLIIAPHCDDEILACGGTIYQALQKDNQVKIIFMTNGEGYRKAAKKQFPALSSPEERAIELGKKRQKESIKGLSNLGLERKQIYFLNYPDKGLANLWSGFYYKPYSASLTKRNSPCEQWGKSFSSTIYTGEDVVKKLSQVITTYKPTDIYYPHPSDKHPDHWATNCFVKYVLTNQQINCREHLYLVHWKMWPTGWVLSQRTILVPPPVLYDKQWYKVQLAPNTLHLKKRSLLMHQSQIAVMRYFLFSFARTNELFQTPQQITLTSKDNLLLKAKKDNFLSHTNGNIQSVHGKIINNHLSLTLTTNDSIKANLSYIFHLRLLNPGQATHRALIKMEDEQITLITENKDSINKIAGLQAKIAHNSITFLLPLQNLPDFAYLFLFVEISKDKDRLDKTEWKMLKK